MNHYTNKWYDMAVAYVQKTFTLQKEISAGYNQNDFSSSSDKTLCAMLNTTIALITSLHHRLDSVDEKILEIESQLRDIRTLFTGDSSEMNQLIDKVSKLKLKTKTIHK